MKSFIFALLACLIFMAVLAPLGGGLRSDLGGDPDEPAHAVTSLMMRDYLVHAPGRNPLGFARIYYEDFPKVAIGHYPPGYYLLGGVALLAWPGQTTLLVLQIVLAALTGALTFIFARRMLTLTSAALAAAVTMALPLMLKVTQHVMADMLLAVVCLLAALCWVRFLEKPSVRASLLFGFVAAAAILTKGSGLLLGAVPVVALLMRRDFTALRTWRWWAAGLPVALLALPWMVLTARITREGMTGQSTSQFFAEAVPYYLQVMPAAFSWGLSLLMLAGLVRLLCAALRGPLPPVESVLLAMLAGGWAIMLLVPAGVTTRYFVPSVPFMAVLALIGAEWLTARLTAKLRPWAVAALVGGSFAFVAEIPQKQVHGFAEAAAHALQADPPKSPTRWLVSSEARGEGAVIAEAAFRLPQRHPSPLRIYRAGKELSASDWLGRGYKAAFATEAEVLAHLDQIGVTWVFVDLSVPEKFRVPHMAQLEQALRSAPDIWTPVLTQPVTRQPGVTGQMLVFRRAVKG